MAALYTSDRHGSDETGNGSQEKPYKTILRVRADCRVSLMETCQGCVMSDENFSADAVALDSGHEPRRERAVSSDYGRWEE